MNKVFSFYTIQPLEPAPKPLKVSLTCSPHWAGLKLNDSPCCPIWIEEDGSVKVRFRNGTETVGHLEPVDVVNGYVRKP